jgi:betaine-homocysteine S-methyltransferase
MHPGLGLLERLEHGPVLCAEGYLFELERRGYLQAGAFVPETVLDHPEVVVQLHRDFVHAGSDVVEAFTYYGHRTKLRSIGKEHLLEPLNRDALAIAKDVAGETDALFAGNISNTNVFDPGDPASRRLVRSMHDEQVGWALEAGVDYVIAETLPWAEEAEIGLSAILDAGLPAVVTLAILDREPRTLDGVPVDEACRRLAGMGAAVVGLNCARGPRTMLPLLAAIRKAVDCHVAGLPVPYRTTEEAPTFVAFDVSDDGERRRAFPDALDPFSCTRHDTAWFARDAMDLGVTYLGLCCGAGPHHVRSMAEAIGRTPPASRYSADMSRHNTWGDEEAVAPSYRPHRDRF